MSLDENYGKKKKLNSFDRENEDDETGQDSASGTGGQSGQIEFHDFLATGANVRDDLLPYDEKRRLLSLHKDIHELRVKQQKEKRDQYKNLKEGKIPLNAYRDGLRASGGSAQFKTNPILAQSAQFSGIDRQVSGLPTENIADTNQEQRDELQNELRYRLGYQPAPTFNPKPQGPGY